MFTVHHNLLRNVPLRAITKSWRNQGLIAMLDWSHFIVAAVVLLLGFLFQVSTGLLLELTSKCSDV